MGKKFVKVYRVLSHRPTDGAATCHLVDAIAHETPYNYTFSHSEAEKSRCHRAGKNGDWHPSPEEALRHFHKVHLRQAELYARQLEYATVTLNAAVILAAQLGISGIDKGIDR
jgi:malate synthase